MNQEDRNKAADELESAADAYFLAVENLRNVGNKFPKLHCYVTEFIYSIFDGDLELGGVDQVIEFLRIGKDEKFGLEGWEVDPDDKYAEHYLLRWNRKNPRRWDEAK